MRLSDLRLDLDLRLLSLQPASLISWVFIHRFSPEAVVEKFATPIKSYRCAKVFGRQVRWRMAGEQFQKRDVFYEPSEKSKSELYRDLLPIINSGAVGLLENDRLVLQLSSLERRTARGGKDSIDHAPGAHDDVANAVAGALVTTYIQPGVKNFDRKLVYPQIGIV